MSRRLYRSSTNKIVAGVCGGLGEYFNIDPVIVRLLVVVFTLMGGSGFVAYLIAYVIIPPDNAVDSSMAGAVQSGGRTIFKIVLTVLIIMMGLGLLAMLMGMFRFFLRAVFGGIFC